MDKKQLKTGEIVQINPSMETFGGCLMVVTEPKTWGAMGYIQNAEKKEQKGRIYCLCEFKDMEQTGGHVNWMISEPLSKAYFVALPETVVTRQTDGLVPMPIVIGDHTYDTEGILLFRTMKEANQFSKKIAEMKFDSGWIFEVDISHLTVDQVSILQFEGNDCIFVTVPIAADKLILHTPGSYH